MLDYVFFHPDLRGRFVAYLDEQRVPYEVKSEEEGMSVALPEDLDEELSDAIDELYDQLMDENAEILESESEIPATAGVTVQLGDGRTTLVPVETGLMNRLFSVMTAEEVRDLFQSVAEAVENPDDRPICKR